MKKNCIDNRQADTTHWLSNPNKDNINTQISDSIYLKSKLFSCVFFSWVGGWMYCHIMAAKRQRSKKAKMSSLLGLSPEILGDFSGGGGGGIPNSAQKLHCPLHHTTRPPPLSRDAFLIHLQTKKLNKKIFLNWT